MYNVSKLATHILRNHKSELEMLDCANMQELVQSLKDKAFADTAIAYLGLCEKDFLHGEEGKKDPAPTPTPKKDEKDIPLPKIFSQDYPKNKPEFLDVTTLAEMLFQQLNPINFPEGVLEDITLDEGFLHNSHSDTSELGVRYKNELIRQFYITQGDTPKSNKSYLQEYDESYSPKAWAKLVLLFDHLSSLIALSETINKAVDILITRCEDDLDNAKIDKFIGGIRQAVQTDLESYETEEENWLCTFLLSQYIYPFALAKHRSNHNTPESYAKAPFIGGGKKHQPTIKPTQEYIKSLVKYTSEQPVKAKPTPKTAPAFTVPSGTNEIYQILIDNEFEVKLPTNKDEMKKFRYSCHECLKYFHSLRGKLKPVDDIKTIEDWLSNTK